MRRALIVLAAVAAGGAALARPARAANTTVTFALSAGVLSISTPGAANLGTQAGSSATVISGQLGNVTVTDARVSLNPAWTATVSVADFTTGAASAGETISKSQISYWSGPATADVGGGTFTPGQATAASMQSLSDPREAFSHTGGTGFNSVTWNPTLSVAVPHHAVVGTYGATVVHSVA